MRFFTSDTHFNSQNTIDMDKRPFSSTKQFDKYVLKLWNKQKRVTSFIILEIGAVAPNINFMAGNKRIPMSKN